MKRKREWSSEPVSEVAEIKQAYQDATELLVRLAKVLEKWASLFRKKRWSDGARSGRLVIERTERESSDQWRGQAYFRVLHMGRRYRFASDRGRGMCASDGRSTRQCFVRELWASGPCLCADQRRPYLLVRFCRNERIPSRK